ncbi:MAG: hypothetical protein N0A16_13105, partial [Blastocatellia bacterium]|nr:hypothetical protein [Blastocatellia bacterium]
NDAPAVCQEKISFPYLKEKGRDRPGAGNDEPIGGAKEAMAVSGRDGEISRPADDPIFLSARTLHRPDE